MAKSMATHQPDFLEKALQLYYWKPSLAIVRAVELEILSHIDMAPPILDLGCDAIVNITEWEEFEQLDYREKIVIDGRRISKASKAAVYEGVCW